MGFILLSDEKQNGGAIDEQEIISEMKNVSMDNNQFRAMWRGAFEPQREKGIFNMSPYSTGFVPGDDKALRKSSGQETDKAMPGGEQETIEKVSSYQQKKISDTKGGVDFNPEFFDIQSQGRGIDIQLPANPQEWENIDIPGLTPYIFNITPINNLPSFLLGAGKPKVEEQLSLR